MTRTIFSPYLLPLAWTSPAGDVLSGRGSVLKQVRAVPAAELSSVTVAFVQQASGWAGWSKGTSSSWEKQVCV